MELGVKLSEREEVVYTKVTSLELNFGKNVGTIQFGMNQVKEFELSELENGYASIRMIHAIENPHPIIEAVDTKISDKVE